MSELVQDVNATVAQRVQSPLVSVCVPVFEAGAFIESAMATVCQQRYTHWELLIVEDGSRSPVSETVRRLAIGFEEQIRYFAHAGNLGPNAARNTAVNASKGDFLAFLDVDDLWTAEHLEALVETQRRSRADIVYSACLLTDESSQGQTEHRAPSAEQLAQFPRSLFLRRMIIQPSSALISKLALTRIGGWDESLRRGEDFELWLRAARAGLSFAFCPVLSCHYRRHSAGASRQDAEIARALVEIYRRNQDWEAIPRPDRRSALRAALTASGRLLWRQSPQSAARYFASALRLRPGPVVFGRWLVSVMLGIAHHLGRHSK